ncbi:MAG: PepSY-associated TM helix domain-containing protein [Pseudomonadota bacterium]
MSNAKQRAAATTQSSFVKRMIDSHSVLGLAFAALIYVVSVSGALTLFVSEIKLWETPQSQTSASASAKAIAAAANNAQVASQEGFEILNVIVTAPNEFRPFLTVRLNERADRNSPLISKDWLADANTGELINSVDTPYAHLIEELHTDLLLPRPWGRYLVGLIGVAMFTLILSGIFAHPTIVKDAFKLRLNRNARMAWTDIHNRLSVWGLPFHLVITFTGAFLGIAGITVAALAMLAYQGDREAAIQVIQGPQAIMEAPMMAAPPDYVGMLRSSAASDREFSLLVANNPRHSGHTTSVAYYEAGILSMRTSDIYRNSGEFLEKFGGRGSPAGSRLFGMVQPLHYGTFGGYPIKFLYFVLSLALTYITSTGMMIWFKRKQQQGQPKIKSEAAWRGMTTGLSFAMALATVLMIAGFTQSLTMAFVICWLASFAIIFWSKHPLAMVRIHYFAIGTVLCLCALTQLPIAMDADAAGKPILYGINLAVFIVGVGFAWSGHRLRPAKRGALEAHTELPA